MEKSIGKLAMITLLEIIFACSALAAETSTAASAKPFSYRRCTAKDFRIDVETNKNIYNDGDVLGLTVKLLNNSPKAAYVGLCPIDAAVADSGQDQVEDVFEGILDDQEVDVAIIPKRPTIIGYATLTRLGPSHVPYPEEVATPLPKPVRFRLPLFGSPVVPPHSTRIISTANILIACPLIEAEVDPIALEGEPADAELDAEAIETIPAIALYVALKPGYYLLDCHIEKIYRTKAAAQAQKIIRIRPRIPQPVPVAKPVP